MADYFMADPHFGHANIIKYCGRPFESVEEMDVCILGNINEVVRPQDNLYIVGDFCMRGKNAAKYRHMISCSNVYFVRGNHDPRRGKERRDFDALFSRVADLMEIKSHGGQRIVLCHYALRTWNCAHYGNWHLYGHSHGTLPDLKDSLSFDIGVDCHDYKPLHFDEVEAIMKTKTFVPLDHHR